MSKSHLVILAAGGTGGHMFPAQSLAENLTANGWKIALTTDQRGLRYTENFEKNVEQVVLPTGSFSQGSLIKRLFAPLRILQGTIRAWRLFSRLKPDVVVGFGGYPALPALMVARLRGVPYFIHEQNAVLGRVNWLFHKAARKVACGLWPVVHAGDNAVFLGNPVRARVSKLEASPLPKSVQKKLVVFGGSQGASVLSQIVPDALAQLPEDLRKNISVTHQAREGEINAVNRTYKNAGIKADIAPFFTDLPERIAASSFVIARSGASTLAELQMIGRGSVLVPLPSAANDHQRLNAKALVAAKAAFEYSEGQNTPEELSAWIEKVLTQKGVLEQMADAAYGLARPDAAIALAELIEKEIKND